MKTTRRVCSLLLCVTPLLLGGCATQVFLHPETARRAFAERPVDPERNGDHPEVVLVTNVFGHRLAGWLFSSATNRGVVLVGDGNATGMAHTYDYNRFLLHQGFNVLILSYQGFDTNEGPAEIKSLAGDVETFYRWCRVRFPEQRVALVAESISTAPFFACASHHQEISGMVLEAMVNPKTVALAKANDWWLFYPLYPTTYLSTLLISAAVPDELDARRVLKCHPVIPALFLHHPKDRVTPYRTARQIFEKYDGPKEWIVLQTGASRERHMDGASDPAVARQVVEFLKASVDPPVTLER